MKAVLLAGGQGTRLRPLTNRLPKNAVPLAGVPFLRYPLERLRHAGVREAVLSAGHLAGRLRRVFGDGRRFGMRLHYAVEREPLGTAGAVKNAERFVRGEDAFVLNGDILSDVDFSEVARLHRRRRAAVTLTLVEVPDPSPFGLVFSDADGRVTRFLEKPPPGEVSVRTINAGVYVFSPSVFARIPAGRAVSSERELFPSLLAEGEPVFAHLHRGAWHDIGRPAQYRRAHREVLEGKFPFLAAGYRFRRGCRVAGGVSLGRGVELQGPAMVGPRCRVEEGARIGPGAALYPRVRVGKRSVVEESVLLEGAWVGEGVVLREVVLGRNVGVEDHSILPPGTVLGSA